MARPATGEPGSEERLLRPIAVACLTLPTGVQPAIVGAMVRPALTLREAEALVVALKQAEARGDFGLVAARVPELEQAIALLMDLNHRLASSDPANALVASLQYLGRLLRQRHQRSP